MLKGGLGHGDRDIGMRTVPVTKNRDSISDVKCGTMGNAGMQSTRNVSVSGKVRVDELIFFFFKSFKYNNYC